MANHPNRGPQPTVIILTPPAGQSGPYSYSVEGTAIHGRASSEQSAIACAKADIKAATIRRADAMMALWLAVNGALSEQGLPEATLGEIRTIPGEMTIGAAVEEIRALRD